MLKEALLLVDPILTRTLTLTLTLTLHISTLTLTLSDDRRSQSSASKVDPP